MCKAKEYSEKLLDIYNSINSDFNHYSEELSQADLYEQDILHIIESGGFNAAEGYKLAKMICDNRQKRRQIKNELEPLSQLKNNFIDNNMKALNSTHQNVIRKDAILTQLTENKVYKPRVLETTDLKIVTSNNKDVEEIVPIYKKTGQPIKILQKVDNNLYYVKFATGYKNLCNKRDILNLDKAKIG